MNSFPLSWGMKYGFACLDLRCICLLFVKCKCNTKFVTTVPISTGSSQPLALLLGFAEEQITRPSSILGIQLAVAEAPAPADDYDAVTPWNFKKGEEERVEKIVK